MSKLHDNFLPEVFKLCFRKRDFLEICSTHLQYQYLPTEAHKSVWKSINSFYKAKGNMPTLGTISQQYAGTSKEDVAALELLGQVRDTYVENEGIVVETLEGFIKRSKFIAKYNQLAEIFNKAGTPDKDGNVKSIDDLFEYDRQTAEEIHGFSLRQDALLMDRVFGDFNKRMELKRAMQGEQPESKTKIPFSIDELDERTGGGCGKTDIALFLAQSGVGKTKLLRHIGVKAAQRGFKVLHIQLEGAKEEAQDGYDATWTAQRIEDLEVGDLPPELLEKLTRISAQVIAGGGDVWVQAYETFESATLYDVIKAVEDFFKVNGCYPDLLLIDYLELLDPGKKKYKVGEERQRREALANGFKNICVTYKMAGISCTQASTVSPEQLNDPKFTQTRYHISEFKGMIKPFSYFFTLNQTNDEYQAQLMRIYADKVRKYKKDWTATIIQDYGHDRFYNSKRTRIEILKREVI